MRRVCKVNAILLTTRFRRRNHSSKFAYVKQITGPSADSWRTESISGEKAISHVSDDMFIRKTMMDRLLGGRLQAMQRTSIDQTSNRREAKRTANHKQQRTEDPRWHPCVLQDSKGACKPDRCPFKHLPADFCLEELRTGRCELHAQHRCRWRHDHAAGTLVAGSEPDIDNEELALRIQDDAMRLLALFADGMRSLKEGGNTGLTWHQRALHTDSRELSIVVPIHGNTGAAASIERGIVVTCLMREDWVDEANLQSSSAHFVHDERESTRSRLTETLARFPFLFHEEQRCGTAMIVLSSISTEFMDQLAPDEDFTMSQLLGWQVERQLRMLEVRGYEHDVKNERVLKDLLGAMAALSRMQSTADAPAPDTVEQDLQGSVSTLFTMLHDMVDKQSAVTSSSARTQLDISQLRAPSSSLATQKFVCSKHVSFWENTLNSIAVSLFCDDAPTPSGAIEQFLVVVRRVARDLETVYGPVLLRCRGVQDISDDDLFDPHRQHRFEGVDEYVRGCFLPLRALFVSHVVQLSIEYCGRSTGLLPRHPSNEWEQWLTIPTLSEHRDDRNDVQSAPYLDTLFAALREEGSAMKHERDTLFQEFEHRHHVWLQSRVEEERMVPAGSVGASVASRRKGGTRISRRMRAESFRQRAIANFALRKATRPSPLFVPQQIMCINGAVTLTLLRHLQARGKEYAALKHCIGMKRLSDDIRKFLGMFVAPKRRPKRRSTDDAVDMQQVESTDAPSSVVELYFEFDEQIGAEACAIAVTLKQDKVLNVFWNALRKSGCVSASRSCLRVGRSVNSLDIVNQLIKAGDPASARFDVQRVGLCSRAVEVMLHTPSRVLGFHRYRRQREQTETSPSGPSPLVVRQVLEAVGRRPDLMEASTLFLLFRCLGSSDAVLGCQLLMHEQWDPTTTTSNLVGEGTSPLLFLKRGGGAVSSIGALKRSLLSQSGQESEASGETTPDDDATTDRMAAAERAEAFLNMLHGMGRRLQQPEDTAHRDGAHAELRLAAGCGLICGLTLSEGNRWVSTLGVGSPPRFLTHLLVSFLTTHDQQSMRDRIPGTLLHRPSADILAALQTHTTADALRTALTKRLDNLRAAAGPIAHRSDDADPRLPYKTPVDVLLHGIEQVPSSSHCLESLLLAITSHHTTPRAPSHY